ncbi:hypothetical protein NP493_597g02006 [Ridgeia piscesae]|uniref:Uncharacterized protein n=1 Tax=Ridgeia piscesae TaxID=27915 RepID=A0AAD9KUB3_RIDPI|nr:hypothetical protein NP493_597g02006 [Ridgeia piscesae]
MKIINECDCLPDLSILYGFPNADPLVQCIQVYAWLDSGFDFEFLCCFFEALCNKIVHNKSVHVGTRDVKCLDLVHPAFLAHLFVFVLLAHSSTSTVF